MLYTQPQSSLLLISVSLETSGSSRGGWNVLEYLIFFFLVKFLSAVWPTLECFTVPWEVSQPITHLVAMGNSYLPSDFCKTSAEMVDPQGIYNEYCSVSLKTFSVPCEKMY